MPGAIPPSPSPPPEVDLKDVQGGIFCDYDLSVESHLFLKTTGVEGARRFVREVLPGVTSAADQKHDSDTRLNMGFTFAGMWGLGLDDALLRSFPVEFREGMAARALLLGDNGKSAPEHWDGPLGKPEVHVWVMIQAATSAPLAGRKEAILRIATACGLELIYDQPGATFPEKYAPAKEHFGFNDLIGQPGVEGVGMTVYPGMGTPREDGGWDPVPVGCFLLGYENAYGRVVTHPNDPVLRKNSTFMAYRKLEQRPALFHQFMRENAAMVGGDRELLAAKMVGRWKSGAPVEMSPHHDDKALGADPMRNNDFRYWNGDPPDPHGQRVPHFAHLRRANPRDNFLENPGIVDVAAHRIIRRSMPYGPFLPQDSPDDGSKRGISFRAFNASLLDQFELVQGVWISGANENHGLSSDRDPIAGVTEPMGPKSRQLEATFSIPMGDHVVTLYDLPRFVRVRGGEYLFVPSLTALASLGAPSAKVSPS